EARPGAKLVDRPRADVAHSRPEAADKLVDGVGDGPLVGHPALDPLRHELPRVALLLEVAVGGSLLHGTEAPHPANRLEPPALEQDGLARALVGAREHGPHHYGMGAGRKCLDDVAGVLDPAVGDDRNTALYAFDRLEHRRQLGDSDAG